MEPYVEKLFIEIEIRTIKEDLHAATEKRDINLEIDSIFTLGTGLARMFQKLALRHGFPQAASSV